MKFIVGGGMYGAPFFFKFIGEDGSVLKQLNNGDARKLHTTLMGLAPGEMRDKATELLYEEVINGQGTGIQEMGEGEEE